MSVAAGDQYVLVDCGPLGAALASYDRCRQQTTRTSPPQSDLDKFADAMHIREEVFVQEQGVPLENELDDEDASCVHIVLYSRTSDNQQHELSTPAGTVRVLPLDDRLPSHLDKHRTIDGSPYTGATRSTQWANQEAFLTLGRLAIMKTYRGRRWAESLVQQALSIACSRPTRFVRKSGNTVPATSWNGLVMIHAQIQARKFWERVGFEIDDSFGIWDEEGIDHIAMWKRVSRTDV